MLGEMLGGPSIVDVFLLFQTYANILKSSRAGITVHTHRQNKNNTLALNIHHLVIK